MAEKETKPETKEEDILDLDSMPESEATVQINVDEFDKEKVKLEGFKIIDATTNYTEEGKWVDNLNRPVKKLMVFSEVLKTAEGKDGKKIEIRASEFINLTKNKDGKWAIPIGDSSNLTALLKTLDLPKGREGLKQIKGKEVICKKRKNNFLGFFYK